MNTDLLDVLGVAIPAITLGLVLLVSMVQLELGPFTGLSAPGKWMLTCAFGMGILAFALKMTVALAVATVPQRVVAPLVSAYPRHLRHDQPERVDTNPGPVIPATYTWQPLPEQAPAPADNPTTPEKVALGRQLFYETRLSGDGSLSCGSCHDLARKAGADGRATARGIRGQTGNRNTPTVLNAAFQSVLFWDGRARSLEEQAKGPILNPMEMGLASGAEAEARLFRDPAYRARFAQVFGDDAITFERIAQAIAAFERTLVTPDAPYDRYVKGDRQALTQSQLRGMEKFQTFGCIKCHLGPAFSDASLVGGQAPLRIFPANATSYTDRFKLAEDKGAGAKGQAFGVWRVPSLRNVALTGPYLHNGAVSDLEEVVRIMASAQLGRSGNMTLDLNQENALLKIDRSALKDGDVEDIVAFLKSLSSDSVVARLGKERP